MRLRAYVRGCFQGKTSKRQPPIYLIEKMIIIPPKTRHNAGTAWHSPHVPRGLERHRPGTNAQIPCVSRSIVTD